MAAGRPLTDRPARGPRGQSLVELAVFGSLALMVLGVLVNYALGADNTLRTTMRTFRLAEAYAGLPPPLIHWLSKNSIAPYGGASVTMIDDRYIPDPSNPFAIGSASPVQSSANVTRDFQLSRDWPQVILPRNHIFVNGKEVSCGNLVPGCTTAGLWFGVGLLDRYREVYGGGGVIPLIQGLDPLHLSKWIDIPIGPFEVLDPCMGQLATYDGCYRIARLIVDPAVCTEDCERSRWWGGLIQLLESKKIPIPCPIVCAIPIIPEPPYVAGRYKVGDRWVFPKIEELFSGAVRNMGIQPGGLWNTSTANALRLHNLASRAVSTTSTDWNDVVTRVLVYQKQFIQFYNNQQGTTSDGQQLIRNVRSNFKHQRDDVSWSTPWTGQ